jgi:hypothetical protein
MPRCHTVKLQKKIKDDNMSLRQGVQRAQCKGGNTRSRTYQMQTVYKLFQKLILIDGELQLAFKHATFSKHHITHSSAK